MTNRVVFDTNILVSYVLFQKSALRNKVDALWRTHEVLRSTETFAEFAAVLMRQKFDSYASIEERERFLELFYNSSEHISVTERIHECRDSRNNKFLELAVCGKAQLLITGDSDLLALSPFRGIHIIAPGGIAS